MWISFFFAKIHMVLINVPTASITVCFQDLGASSF